MNDKHWNEIDEGLERLAGVGEVVKALPEDVPSMAWRSTLNERLRDAATPNRKPRRLLAWLSGASLAGAAALAIFIVNRPEAIGDKPNLSGESGLEAAIIAAHEESVGAYEVTTAGMSLRPTRDEGLDEDVDWNANDLGTL
ncbi:MAG: hypothetical protein HONBIEJF_02015 [Fimbriimonadaceae bacterium]|nr:hypothetical protein [Fimbriimonadaceae bacterium]